MTAIRYEAAQRLVKRVGVRPTIIEMTRESDTDAGLVPRPVPS